MEVRFDLSMEDKSNLNCFLTFCWICATLPVESARMRGDVGVVVGGVKVGREEWSCSSSAIVFFDLYILYTLPVQILVR